MFTQITSLRYWKSEHDADTYEDAVSDDSSRGLFAIADGAGTTLFSHIWAKALVDFFVNVPLMSDNSFEVEWWIRQAQELYKQRMPQLAQMTWNAQQKIQKDGSYATLATLRISHVQYDAAQAELLTVGDSCIFLKKAHSEQILSFPLTQPTDFDRAPLCFPSKPALFNRTFHRCFSHNLSLSVGDTLIMATDAVARWIISAAKGRYHQPIEAWQELWQQNAASWPDFIQECRARGEMLDDDCTALLLTMYDTAQSEAVPLGATSEHSHEVRTQRKYDFERVSQEQNKELVAIYYGDGADLALEGIVPNQQEITQAQRVANALQAVLQVLRQNLNSPDLVMQVGAVWEQYASLLQTEVCARNLRQTLIRIGVIATPATTPSIEPDSPPQEPQQPSPLPSRAQASETQLSTISPMQELERERHRVALTRNFIEALRVDNDNEILAAYDAILQFADAQTFTFKPSEIERIALVRRHVNERQGISDILHTQNIEQMAGVYTQLPRDSAFLTDDDRECFKLAHEFVEAGRIGDDELFAAYERIIQSPYRSMFSFTDLEEQRITSAWRKKLLHNQEVAQSLISGASDPTISTVWFDKVCTVKTLYLPYKMKLRIQPPAIENAVLDDLTNDVYIQEGIKEVNQHQARRKKLDTERILAQEVENFKEFLKGISEAILQKYQITDQELTAILGIFVRNQIFAQYLEQHNESSLYTWLDERKRSRAIVLRRDTPHKRPWYQFLGGWRGI